MVNFLKRVYRQFRRPLIRRPDSNSYLIAKYKEVNGTRPVDTGPYPDATEAVGNIQRNLQKRREAQQHQVVAFPKKTTARKS